MYIYISLPTNEYMWLVLELNRDISRVGRLLGAVLNMEFYAHNIASLLMPGAHIGGGVFIV